MIVSISWCKKKTKCAYCKEHVEPGHPMLIKRVWSKKNKRMYVYCYHVTCLIREMLEYLETQPYEAALSKRKRLQLSKEEKRERELLLRRRASIRQRIRRWQDSGDERANEKIYELLKKELEIAKQISKVGGVPKNWSIDKEELSLIPTDMRYVE